MKWRSLATLLVAAVPVVTFACGDETSSSNAQAGSAGTDAAAGGEGALGAGAHAGSSGGRPLDTAGSESATSGQAGQGSPGTAEAGAPSGGMSTNLAGEASGGMSTATAGAGGEGGVLSDPCLAAEAPSIETVGDTAHLLLRGMIVTPDQAFAGEVLVTDDIISCVAASCSAAAGAASATIVNTGGIVFPGLIDVHNHILFDTFDETDWAPLQAYGNHNQWTNEARYSAMVDAKQYLNGEGTSPDDYGCELDKYGEIKGLIAGTTSIVGAANPANKGCYGTLARTIDQTPNGLGADKIQIATLFPDAAAADGACANFASGKTDAYLIHVAEGTDTTAKNEFPKLNTISTIDGCLLGPQTTIVHGTALGDAEFDVMAAHQMSLVWSPRSEIFLYGAGTDLTKTTNIPVALAKGINVALGSDWSLSGSQNLLDELRFAQKVSNTTWAAPASPKTLVQMVTSNAARVLGLQSVLGSIEVGKKADLMVIRGNACTPYDALLASTPADVQLVLVGGKALYGHPALEPLATAPTDCESFNACSTAKFICVAAPSQSATDKFAQSLSDIQTTLSSAIEAYDGMNLSQWRFAPLTPLVRCP